MWISYAKLIIPMWYTTLHTKKYTKPKHNVPSWDHRALDNKEWNLVIDIQTTVGHASIELIKRVVRLAKQIIFGNTRNGSYSLFEA